MAKMHRNKTRIIIAVLVLAGLLVISYRMIRFVFGPNVYLHGRSEASLFIRTGSDFNAVLDSLVRNRYLISERSFQWTATRKGYPGHVRPGRYLIRNGMTNYDLVDLLRSGKQTPVRVTFQSIRTPQDLAARISAQIEADSLSLIRLFRDPEALTAYHVTPATLFTIIIPNTYEFYWNTTAPGFLARMYRESRRFWTEVRLQQASANGLTVLQVVTLASIVERETSQVSEMPEIAGVYMNRLRRGMPLQADPTLIFAWNDYSIHRVLNKHKEIDSPYNTYTHSGLPPGPICLPSIHALDAVLRYSHHDYLYFCAREDFSGYHYFSKTLSEHNLHARAYQQALKRAGIMN